MLGKPSFARPLPDNGIWTLTRNFYAPGGPGDNPFTGMGNVPGVPEATFVVSNQRWKKGIGTNNANIRVDAAQSDIGYLDNKFSGDDYDTAVGAGPELVTEGEEFASGWGGFGGGTAVQSTDQAFEGTYSLKTTGSSAFDGMQSDVNIAVVAATKYRVTTRVYGDGVASIVFRVIDGGNLSDKYGPGGTNGIVYPAGWNYVAWEFTADDTENLRMQSYSRFAGAFTVYYDVISLTTGELAFTSTWYDQIGSSDAVQTGTTLQPEMTREGVSVFDGSNDRVMSPYEMSQGDNFSFMIVMSHPVAEVSIPLCMDNVAARSWNFITRADDKIELPVWKSSSKSNVFSNATAWAGQGDTVFICTYDSSVGWVVEQNGTNQTVTTNTTGTVDTGASGTALGSRGDGTLFYDGNISGFAFWESTLTPTNATDLYNQWVINNAL